MASKGSFQGRVWEPLKEIGRTPVLRLILLLTLHVLSALSLLSSFTPSLLTNYFASVHSDGAKIECTGHAKKEDLPKTCHSATNDVLLWKSGAAIVTNFVVGVFLYPSLGTWSDLLGRKPFIILGFIGGIFPPLSVILYLRHGLPLWWYFLAGILFQSVNPFLTAFAYVADVISPSGRTVAFATLGVVFSVAFTVGPILIVSGLISTAEIAAWASLGCAIVSVVGAVFILPESLSKENMAAARVALEGDQSGAKGCASSMRKLFRVFWGSFTILFRTKFFTKLTICILALYLNFEEVFEMQIQYFQEVAGFNEADTANLFAVAGLSSWFTITFVLWLLLSVFRMSAKQVLLFGMIAFALQQLLYAFVRSKVVILIVTALGTTANLVQPAISSLKSNNVAPEEQGGLQGAILSAQSVAKGFGPLLFYLFFVVFRSNGCYLPGAPFLFGFVVLVAAIGVGFTLEVPNPGWREKQNSTEERHEVDSAPLLVSHPITPSDSDEEFYV